MTLDVTARATALRLIAKFVKGVSYTSVTDGTYDPATSSVSPSEVVVSLKAIIEEFGRYGDGYSSGLIRAGDKKVTFAASGLTFVPKQGDKVAFDGDTLTVLNVTPTFSGELVAIYMVHGRK